MNDLHYIAQPVVDCFFTFAEMPLVCEVFIPDHRHPGIPQDNDAITLDWVNLVERALPLSDEQNWELSIATRKQVIRRLIDQNKETLYTWCPIFIFFGLKIVCCIMEKNAK